MSDWPLIAWRFGLYLDLLLLFGLAAYPLHGGAVANSVRLAILAALGLLLNGGAFLSMTADMAGVSIGAIDGNTLRFVTLQTAAGTAFLLRMAALVAALLFAFTPSSVSRWLLPLPAATALATLAWTGHAAVTEGAAGALHRASDVVHLLAAGAWIGALAILLGKLVRPAASDSHLSEAQAALAAFAIAGTILVASIIATGLVNILMIAGPTGLSALPASLYGQLLLAKLALFAAMLGFAAANRWRLTPRLAAARTQYDQARAARALRTSIALEAAAAMAILALVAWLGTLAPNP